MSNILVAVLNTFWLNLGFLLLFETLARNGANICLYNYWLGLPGSAETKSVFFADRPITTKVVICEYISTSC